MPPQDRGRLNDSGQTEQPRPQPGHQHQQRAITTPQPKTWKSSPQGDVELMTESMRAKPFPYSKSGSAIISISVDLPVPVPNVQMRKTVLVLHAKQAIIIAKIDAGKLNGTTCIHITQVLSLRSNTPTRLGFLPKSSRRTC